MPDPRDIIEAFRAFRARHSRAFGGVHQVLLCMVTFECAVAIARFGPLKSSAAAQEGLMAPTLRRNQCASMEHERRMLMLGRL
jgi:hypothetical protein